MSDNVTKVLLGAYEDQAPERNFLLRMTTPVFHSQEKVEWDAERDGEEVAPVIEIGTGVNMNVSDVYTNKELTPAYYNEGMTLNAWDLMGREIGQNPFESNNFQVKAGVKVMKGFSKLNRKLSRAGELQMAQILTTGQLSVEDKEGNALYTVDYKPKASHFPTAGTAWSNAAADIEGDLISLCDQVSQDGKKDPKMLLVGQADFEAMKKNTGIKELLDLRRLEGTQIDAFTESAGGGLRRGMIEVGNYKLEIYTYNARYQKVKDGTSFKFIPDGKAVVLAADSGDFVATYGAVPRIVPIDPRLGFLPTRISSEVAQADGSINAYVDERGTNLTVEVGTRMVIIPKGLDTFGCITTGI